MKKIKIGDIFEISTPRGLAYAQYTHRHAEPPKYGPLIRVLRGLYKERPRNLLELASGPANFSTFFPLQTAVNKNIVSIIGNEPIPIDAQDFPIFRAGIFNPQTGKVDVWWLWDGNKEWRVETLTPEQKRFPIRGVINDTLLIERIISGWTPETDSTS